jgi:hypothetical protein
VGSSSKAIESGLHKTCPTRSLGLFSFLEMRKVLEGLSTSANFSRCMEGAWKVFNNGVYQSIDTIRQMLAISEDGSPIIIGFNNSFDSDFSI